MKPVYFRDVFNSWRLRDIAQFKKHVHALSPRHFNAVVRVLEPKSARLLDKKNFHYTQVLLEWIQAHEKNQPQNWHALEKRLLSDSHHIKAKNSLYLSVCDIFADSKYIVALPRSFALDWPEGWTLFALNTLHKMNSQTRNKYLLQTLLHITPELLEEVQQVLSLPEIAQVLMRQSQVMGPQYFWASDTPARQSFRDEQTSYLLEWSRTMGFDIVASMNVHDYINTQWPETFVCLLQSVRFEGMQDTLNAARSQDSSLFASWLSYHKLHAQLAGNDEKKNNSNLNSCRQSKI